MKNYSIRLGLIIILAVSVLVVSGGFFLFSAFSSSMASHSLPSRATLRLVERGIYLTKNSILDKKSLAQTVKNARAAGLNSVVIDVKEILQPELNSRLKNRTLFQFQIERGNPILIEIIDYLHAQGFIVSGRIVAFKDSHITMLRPDLAIQSAGGKVWVDRSGARWADPFSREVWEYNILLAEIAAWSGIDEVQYDYVRFPTEGAVAAMVFPHRPSKETRPQCIAAFLKSARARLHNYNVALTADIFGVVAWPERRDIESLGQDITLLADSVDAICPMLYPSHFSRGYAGFSFPGNEPYYFLQKGISQIKNILVSAESPAKTKSCEIIPWIQGFGWGTTIFGPDYISQQIKAAQAEGVNRFLIWNASNNYYTSYRALSEKQRK